MLAALLARSVVASRVALVVAHPDDETIAAGGSLHLLPDLLLVHVTDGAPRDLHDARRCRFETAEAYAAAREEELAAALALAGAQPRRARLLVADQEAAGQIGALADRLRALFVEHGTQAVLTHAYEGGHPDHDATACAAHRAAGRLGVPVFEFAGYHAGPDGTMRVQRFLSGGETHVVLPETDAARKRAMLGCFRTQAGILSAFDAGAERFRPAPRYDFAAPPHPGPLNYENWGWSITGERWRALAAAGMACAA